MPSAGSLNTVLIVEDDTVVAATVRQLLERLGWAVPVAACGREALACLAVPAPGFCLVLMDMELPDISGRRLFGKMRRRQPGLPVVVCSGGGAGGDVRRLLERGALGFLPKPFSIKSLKSILARRAAGETEAAWQSN